MLVLAIKITTKYLQLNYSSKANEVLEAKISLSKNNKLKQ